MARLRRLLCVAGWSVGDRASVRAHVFALSDVALRSAAAARRWTVRGVRGGSYEMLLRRASIFPRPRIEPASRALLPVCRIFITRVTPGSRPCRLCGNVRSPFSLKLKYDSYYTVLRVLPHCESHPLTEDENLGSLVEPVGSLESRRAGRRASPAPRRSHTQIGFRPTRSRNSICVFLLLKALGDLEANPGPARRRNPRSPAGESRLDR